MQWDKIEEYAQYVLNKSQDKDDEVKISNPIVLDQQVKSIPLGRLAEPEDIASTISFIVSEEANYITGEVITVGGGKNRL